MPVRPSLMAGRDAIRNIVRLAWPMLISQWAGIAFSVLDSTMLGHTNPVSLQAMALSVSIFMTIHIGLMGVIHALVPICAQLFGAQRHTDIGRFIGQGIWLSLFLSVLGGSLLLFPDVWLSFSGDLPAQVRQEVTVYLRICCLALPAALMFRCVYALATAVQRPRLLMYVSLASVLAKLLFNWLLIFGHIGFPALGSAGAAASTAIVSWLALTAGIVAILDRKSTRLNSSHVKSSYAGFCLKKKNTNQPGGRLSSAARRPPGARRHRGARCARGRRTPCR